MPRNPDPKSRGFDTAPKPEGWVGGSDDFTFITTGTSGRVALNVEVSEGEYDPRGWQRRVFTSECFDLFDSGDA